MQLYSVDQKHELFPAMSEAGKSPEEWKVITIEIGRNVIEQGYGVEAASLQLSQLLGDYEGSIFTDSDSELIILVNAAGDVDKTGLLGIIQSAFSKGSYTVAVQAHDELYELPKIAVTLKRPSNILHIMADKGLAPPTLSTRKQRQENVILVVEDDPMMRKMATKAMGGYDAQFAECGDGLAAMAAYYEKNPDIVFLDIHMPGKKGHAVLQEILRVDPNAYVVMLSGDSAREQVLAAVKSGAKGFVAKPFTKEKLMQYVEQCPSITLSA